ncbi:MAG: DUF429 domain-containing protein [Ilumatobacteraceae bacterium]
MLGIDLAWGEGDGRRPPNETGVVATDGRGRVLDAGWTRGVEATAQWMERWASADAVAMVDAPLVVDNATGMRECEREVGRRYGRWKVAANCSNLGMAALAGVSLVRRAAADGWRYAAGDHGPPTTGRHLFEVYPYTTLVGAPELGYAEARPVYKRRPTRLSPAEFRVARATVCDDLVRRLVDLRAADPPIDLACHPVTAALVGEPTPLVDRQVKHREDLIDAVLCAWTGLLWLRHGLARCQVLGADATIIAPARPEQRR